MRLRSMLFAPANRGDFVAKLPRSGADSLVADLEDAVPLASKAGARAALPEIIAGVPARGADQLLLVRVNAVTSPLFALDVAAAARCPIDGIVVPKLERAEHVDQIRTALAARNVVDWVIVAGIETARGVHLAEEVLDAGVDGCYFGAEDFVTDMGGRRTAGNAEVLYARSRVALVARLAGVPALDQVVTDLQDADRFRADAHEGRNIGYSGKLCVHPRQVALVHECYAVSAEELAWAHRVLAAEALAATDGRGVFEVDGQMIDEPLILRARRLIAAAGSHSPEDVPATTHP
ncbi:MAG TPA: CoA ester lyase [Ilumatobacteraceae bacterium]|nr:CoA ester lyase [Ilumatobacteraceae bacterium]